MLLNKEADRTISHLTTTWYLSLHWRRYVFSLLQNLNLVEGYQIVG